MISQISGRLLSATPHVVVDVGGLGYVLTVPMSTFCSLPPVGTPVTLLAHLVIKEDSHQLFGFATAEERTAFRELLRVTGIGPRSAIAVLSGLSVAELAKVIADQDAKRLTQIPGIGAKIAERVVLDLKTRFAKALPAAGDLFSGQVRTDILQAITGLGYGDKEALAALKNLPADVSLAEGIRLALKTLVK